MPRNNGENGQQKVNGENAQQKVNGENAQQKANGENAQQKVVAQNGEQKNRNNSKRRNNKRRNKENASQPNGAPATNKQQNGSQRPGAENNVRPGSNGRGRGVAQKKQESTQSKRGAEGTTSRKYAPVVNPQKKESTVKKFIKRIFGFGK